MSPSDRPSAMPKVVVATTVALSFISFWRGAAIVLADLASSMFYAGGIAEQAIGRAAPWFILGGDAVQLRGALRVHGELQHVRARRRVRRRARQHGPVHGAPVGFGAGVRLHPHWSHQLGDRRPIHGAPAERDQRDDAPELPDQSELLRRVLRRGGDRLLLVAEHQGNSRIEQQGAAHSADHDGNGGGAPHLVPHHTSAPWPRADSAGAGS